MQNKVSHWASGDEAISFDSMYIRQELDSTHIILITIIYSTTESATFYGAACQGRLNKPYEYMLIEETQHRRRLVMSYLRE